MSLNNMANIYNGIDIDRFEPFDSCEKLDSLFEQLESKNIALTSQLVVDIAVRIHNVQVQLYLDEKAKEYRSKQNQKVNPPKHSTGFPTTTEDIDLINAVIKAAEAKDEKKKKKKHKDKTSKLAKISAYNKDNTSPFENYFEKFRDSCVVPSHVNDGSMIRYRSDKYVPGRTKVKDDEGPRKKVIYIPMGGKTK